MTLSNSCWTYILVKKYPGSLAGSCNDMEGAGRGTAAGCVPDPNVQQRQLQRQVTDRRRVPTEYPHVLSRMLAHGLFGSESVYGSRIYPGKRGVLGMTCSRSTRLQRLDELGELSNLRDSRRSACQRQPGLGGQRYHKYAQQFPRAAKHTLTPHGETNNHDSCGIAVRNCLSELDWGCLLLSGTLRTSWNEVTSTWTTRKS